MKVDASIDFDAPLEEMPRIARAAEEVGFAGVWTAETRHDPFLPLALAAEHTSRVELGTAVTVAFARSPTSVAHVAWDLARLSRGRFVLGLGSQVRAHVERRFGMPWSGRPVSQLRDYLAAVRAVWAAWQDGTPLRLRSEHYPLSLMTPFFSPGRIDHPAIPIYLAGVGAPMIRLAGEVADGFLVHPLHSRAYLADVVRPALAAGAERIGRDATAVVVSASLIVASDDAEREAARTQIAFYASTPSYRPVLEHHGWGAVADELGALARSGQWEAMPRQIDDAMLDAFSVVASPDELPAAIRSRCAGLVDRVSLYRPFVPGADDAGWAALVQGLGTA
jgi:probable F420-dependent oxidoreductase